MMLILFAALVPNASAGITGRGRHLVEHPAIVYLGRISYGMLMISGSYRR